MATDIFLSRTLGWWSMRIVVGITVLSLFLLAGSAGAVPAEEWNRTFGGTGDYYARSVLQASDGGYILSGYTGAFEAGDYAWLRKTNIDGIEIWNKTFRRGTINVVYSVQQIQDGGYILAGDAFLPGADDRVAWLIKVSGESTGTAKAKIVASPTGTLAANSTQVITAETSNDISAIFPVGLSDEDKEKAIKIALSDEQIKEKMQGKTYQILEVVDYQNKFTGKRGPTQVLIHIKGTGKVYYVNTPLAMLTSLQAL